MILRLLAKYRRTVVLASAVLVSFLLMTMEARKEENLTPFLKRILLESVSPLLKASAYVKRTTQGIWENYVDLRVVREENVRLKEQVQDLETRLTELEEARRENQRLKTLLDLQDQQPFHVTPARVMGKDATNWFHSVLIDRGSHDGVARHMVVIASGGLVGQVVDVAPSSARVQLITDPVSSVGALLQNSRATGLLVGAKSGRLRIRYLPVRAEVLPGEPVITSGLGGLYPKGILAGEVVAVDRRSGALFQEATVKPNVDFSRLEDVLVLTRERKE